ncbi:Binding-protein-dependent transport systems inner membrane component OS=Tsukamurella paurometabola(strain ATCC 8368 / DSM / CCUG 35730 / CIP 100753 / JCM 10117 / KCTC 9821 / NBRC 16120 / NCIMB 702349 / NCTC 13040)OX=521096 GN=Tpau_1970 PE=3 SV=1 [Tsukamurella paurometabola]|uniref:Binding-protein-dependent transport systems inner membrane component n=1 Tax=Tsukamurella paurometabola (strain ATCC 8368 / DSM 20162 / CCUG 35730 / CIP 100753 / JCM 10117 / KCTC 9821 / NBRC 16120 / NCIMB 702349 / NCTC 13040) TaxID=521096 RepID=D5UNL4_TSUPD|nr:binding-protein-dependent transport systems inner membrane component [Tsukamurella paurometabola DSM 20162]SUP32287.1 Oligopeptide transport system permease protein oppB [Tsukamurella paurometabola]
MEPALVETLIVARRGRGRTAGRLLLVRVAIAFPVLLVVSLALFALAGLSPFDPLATYLGGEYQSASQAQREAAQVAYGLDASWWSAWWRWACALLSGDLGFSSTKGRPVAEVLAQGLPFTIGLSATALLIAAAAAITLGAVAGMRSGSRLDKTVSALATALAATPPFVVSLLLVAVFAVGLRALPTSGARAPGEPYTLGGIVSHAALPVTALALSQMPWLLLSMRSAVVDAARSDAVRGARARGISGATLLRGHIGPMSVLPTLALLGTRLPEVIAGATIVETVFGWPGIASALVDSATALDFPLFASLSLLAAAAVLAGSALADAAAVWLDPRIELAG